MFGAHLFYALCCACAVLLHLGRCLQHLQVGACIAQLMFALHCVCAASSHVECSAVLCFVLCLPYVAAPGKCLQHLQAGLSSAQLLYMCMRCLCWVGCMWASACSTYMACHMHNDRPAVPLQQQCCIANSCITGFIVWCTPCARSGSPTNS
jgi:hypothetical protein